MKDAPGWDDATPSARRPLILQCTDCGAQAEAGPLWSGCPACRDRKVESSLFVPSDLSRIGAREDIFPVSDIWTLDAILPFGRGDAVTMGEGGTPLIHCKRMGDTLGLNRLFVKDETQNPTGSHKDRSVSVALTDATIRQARTVAIASSGNHGVAVAAYAAKAGIQSVILLSKHAPALARDLIQIFGGLAIEAEAADRWALLEAGVRRFGWYPCGGWTRKAFTGNPYAGQGYKSIAFELAYQLKWKAPDFVVVPTGTGELLFGLYQGFNELLTLGWVDRLPRLVSVEPDAGAPLYRAHNSQGGTLSPIDLRKTIAISIAAPISSHRAVLSLRQTDGIAFALSDQEILEAYESLPKLEGLALEAASAASVAAAHRLVSGGHARPTSTIVCIGTSGASRDIAWLPRQEPRTIPSVSADLDDLVERVLGAYEVDLTRPT